MRKKPTTLSPVERALVAKKWNESTWDANIHALLSADVGKLVGKGGCVFFVAIALARQNCPNSPDHRIIRATMNAVYEVSETDEIDDLTPELSRATKWLRLQRVVRTHARGTPCGLKR